MRNPVVHIAAMALVSLIVLFVLAPYDIEASVFAWKNQFTILETFFNDNFYQHRKFGIADIVVLISLGSLILYGLSFTERGRALRKWRAHTGYILNAGFASAVSVIHSSKWAFSRARPHDVFPDKFQNFTEWYLPGTYTLDVGFNKGSFPGGHVATMSALFTLFFLMPRKGTAGTLRWFYYAFVVILSILMGCYRTMYADHWMTDNVASLFLAIMITYGYYTILHFPDASIRSRYPWTNSVDGRRPGWEIMMVFLTLVWFYSVAAVVVGIRIMIRQHIVQGAGMFLGGILLTLIFTEISTRIMLNRSLFIRR